MANRDKRRGQGEGNIRQRPDGMWEARYSLGYNERGKRIRKSVYGKTYEEVKLKLREILYTIDKGEYIEPSKITLKEWLEKWLVEYKKDSVKPTTYMRYRVTVNTHIVPELGHIKLQDLKTDDIQRHINKKFKSGYAKKINDKNRKQEGLSFRSVEYIYTTIHNALRQAVFCEILNRNVSVGVKLPVENKINERRVFSLVEQKAFLSACAKHPYRLAFFLALTTGMRLGELCALTWQDVNFVTGTIKINKNLQRVKMDDEKSKLEIQKSPKTRKGFREIPISPEILPILEKEKKLKGYVCVDENGNILEPRRLTRHFDKLIKEIGISDFTFHCLRHTFATRAIEAGMNIKVLSDILGHTSISTTLDLYGHVLENTRQKEMQKMNFNLVGVVSGGKDE